MAPTKITALTYRLTESILLTRASITLVCYIGKREGAPEGTLGTTTCGRCAPASGSAPLEGGAKALEEHGHDARDQREAIKTCMHRVDLLVSGSPHESLQLRFRSPRPRFERFDVCWSESLAPRGRFKGSHDARSLLSRRAGDRPPRRRAPHLAGRPAAAQAGLRPGRDRHADRDHLAAARGQPQP